MGLVAVMAVRAAAAVDVAAAMAAVAMIWLEAMAQVALALAAAVAMQLQRLLAALLLVASQRKQLATSMRTRLLHEMASVKLRKRWIGRLGFCSVGTMSMGYSSTAGSRPRPRYQRGCRLSRPYMQCKTFGDHDCQVP